MYSTSKVCSFKYLESRTRDPDVKSVELCGAFYMRNHEYNNFSKIGPWTQVMRMYWYHPMLVWDHTKVMYYRFFWESWAGRFQEYFVGW